MEKPRTFRQLLDWEHDKWDYTNVDDRRTRAFLKRLNNDKVTPDFID